MPAAMPSDPAEQKGQPVIAVRVVNIPGQEGPSAPPILLPKIIAPVIAPKDCQPEVFGIDRRQQ